MSNTEWTLEPNAERAILVPWLLMEPNDDAPKAMLRYVAGLLANPFRPHLEDRDRGIFAIEEVPRAGAGLGWTLNTEGRQVVLFYVG